MAKSNEEQLLSMSADCDRAIVRVTTKAPASFDLEDIRYLTRVLANARDALRWAAPRSANALPNKRSTER